MSNIPGTNVPAITWGTTGPVVPTGPQILLGVQSDYNVAFNVSFNFSPSTPQGQLTGTEAAVVNNAYQFWAWLVSQVDPAYATGRMQDAIARIYFLERNPAEATVVACTCVGLAGVVIPEGALAQAIDGNLYLCTGAGTIPAGGSITLQFACTVPGPITCPAGTLTQIYNAIPGWDTITNPSDGVIGRNTESRSAFETRRAASVAANSRGSVQAVQGVVLSVAGVLDCYVTENVLGTNATIGGVTLVPHSLYVAVVGGTDQDVANAIWSKKAPGCNYNGNTSVSVVDNSPGYSPPLPTYTVTFQRPSNLEVLFAVNIINSVLVPADAALQIQNAIIAAFSGQDGGAPAHIGSTINATRYIPPVLALGAWAQVISLQIGSNNAPSSQFTATVAGTTLTVSAVSSGAIAIGQTISGAGILPGTRIVSGSGSTWVLNTSYTIGSPTAMIGATPTNQQVSVNINQAPVVDANNIVVTLT